MNRLIRLTKTVGYRTASQWLDACKPAMNRAGMAFVTDGEGRELLLCDDDDSLVILDGGYAAGRIALTDDETERLKGLLDECEQMMLA